MTTDNIFVLSDASAPNVVSFAEESQKAEPNRFAACRDLHAYWDALRGPRLVPSRAEFKPRGVEQTLQSTFIAEKIAPRLARIRVSGSVMNDVLGMDVRGMPITSFFDPASRDALSDVTREIFSTPSMVVLELTARAGFGRKPIHARMILLPMSDQHGEINRIVGCLDTPDGLGKKPCRFQITSLRTSALTGDAIIPAPEKKPEFETNLQTPSFAFAEEPSRFRSSRRPSKQKEQTGNLRLVVCNE